MKYSSSDPGKMGNNSHLSICINLFYLSWAEANHGLFLNLSIRRYMPFLCVHAFLAALEKAKLSDNISGSWLCIHKHLFLLVEAINSLYVLLFIVSLTCSYELSRSISILNYAFVMLYACFFLSSS